MEEIPMATDPTDPIYLAAAQGGQQPELMLSAVLHLMSHYTADGKGCVKLASVIERHLKALGALPGLSPVLAATCLQLSEQWAGVVERTMPPPQKKDDGFLARLMQRSRPAAQAV
jgi:hypothetical protein